MQSSYRRIRVSRKLIWTLNCFKKTLNAFIWHVGCLQHQPTWHIHMCVRCKGINQHNSPGPSNRSKVARFQTAGSLKLSSPHLNGPDFQGLIAEDARNSILDLWVSPSGITLTWLGFTHATCWVAEFIRIEIYNYRTCNSYLCCVFLSFWWILLIL